MSSMTRRSALTVLVSAPILVSRFLPAAENADSGSDLTLLVMDPLSRELSCPCVAGYAQRNYDELGKHLAAKLNRPVKVVYSASLVSAKANGKLPDGVDLIIGKRSVVEFDAKAIQTKVTPVASLSGKDGSTTQRGLIVVPTKDPARNIADLKGYQLYFGTEDSDEKYKAALALLKENGVAVPAKLETCAACSEGATKLLELEAGVHAAAIISSYAAPLLEGCGTVQKGDLRVIGKTSPVPFITAFTTERVSPRDQAAIREILLELIDSPKLCEALETQRGFVELADTGDLAKKK